MYLRSFVIFLGCCLAFIIHRHQCCLHIFRLVIHEEGLDYCCKINNPNNGVRQQTAPTPICRLLIWTTACTQWVFHTCGGCHTYLWYFPTAVESWGREKSQVFRLHACIPSFEGFRLFLLWASNGRASHMSLPVSIVMRLHTLASYSRQRPHTLSVSMSVARSNQANATR